jgi:glucose/arabinose dehydrogenase
MFIKSLLVLMFSFFAAGCSTATESASAPKTNAESDSPKVPASKVIPKFKVETVATGLEVVWSIVFAPDGRMIIAERPGRIRVFENGKLKAEPLFVVKDVEPGGESGLMGLTLHPNFKENRLLYFAYVYVDSQGERNVRVARYKETGETLIEPKTIIEGIPSAQNHAGTRLRFGPDGKLYITTGDAFKQKRAQDLSLINGKTLRLNDDGTIPPDNPFVGQKGARPEIWTYGHRNAQGMDFQPGSGLMFQTEHGPSLVDGASLLKRTGGDEVNIVERGKNYGWDKISHSEKREGMETPVIEFSPAIAPASGMFYNGSLFPDFKGNFFLGGLKGERIIRLVFDGRKLISKDDLLKGEYGRIRDIAEGPDGAIYFGTSNRDGRGDPAKDDDRILKLVPVK